MLVLYFCFLRVSWNHSFVALKMISPKNYLLSNELIYNTLKKKKMIVMIKKSLWNHKQFLTLGSKGRKSFSPPSSPTPSLSLYSHIFTPFCFLFNHRKLEGKIEINLMNSHCNEVVSVEINLVWFSQNQIKQQS